MNKIINILKYAKKYYKYFVIGVVSLFIGTLVQLVPPQLIREFVSGVENKVPEIVSLSVSLAVGLLILYIINSVSTFLKSYYLHKAAWSFICDLRVMLFEKLESLSMKYYSKRQTGELMSRVTSDTAVLETLFAHSLPDLIVNIVTFFGVLGILLTINVKLTLYSMAVMPVLAIAGVIFAVKVRPIFKISHQKTAELSAALQDSFSGMKEVQVFNKQSAEKKRIKKYAEGHRVTILNALLKSAVYHPTIELCNGIGMVMIVLLGGFLVADGALNNSDIIAFVLYISSFYKPMTTLGRLNEDFQNAMAAIDRILEIFDTESEVKDAEDAYDMPKAKGEVEYKNVSFAYNQAEVLKNISVHVKPGETLALVGATGAGKTTFINLLARFYEPSSGEILIDGHNVKNITQKSLRDNLSVVLQDVFLFNGTIFENIAYGKEGATKEEVKKAAIAANAHEFIMETERGYNTMIGERGIRLSGGQKQRIAIARAVLRDTPILILDEATAAVDTATERKIQSAIDEISKNRTTIVIAHRLSTVKKADHILVVDKGEITEYGNHESLLAKNGKYATLCKIQFGEE